MADSDVVDVDPRVAAALVLKTRYPRAELASVMASRAQAPEPVTPRAQWLWTRLVQCIGTVLVDHEPELATMDSAEAAHYTLGCIFAGMDFTGPDREIWDELKSDLQTDDLDHLIRYFLVFDVVPAIARAGHFELAGEAGRRLKSDEAQ